jgi:peptidoglycan/xylan/chitin deacetylase (PgdA/CDA1 family)
MRWLREESGLAVVPLERGWTNIANGTMSGTAVAVTFDDGFLDVLTAAAPLLAQYRIPFTVFAVGAYLDRPPAPGRYLDVGALRELAAVPDASIGAHGFTHRPLTRLRREELDDDLHRSREVLASALGAPPSTIGYPHGAVNREVVDRVEAAGFAIGATSFAGVNRPGVHPLCLRRMEIHASDALAEFSGKLRGDYDWYRLKQRVYWPVPR